MRSPKAPTRSASGWPSRTGDECSTIPMWDGTPTREDARACTGPTGSSSPAATSPTTGCKPTSTISASTDGTSSDEPGTPTGRRSGRSACGVGPGADVVAIIEVPAHPRRPATAPGRAGPSPVPDPGPGPRPGLSAPPRQLAPQPAHLPVPPGAPGRHCRGDRLRTRRARPGNRPAPRGDDRPSVAAGGVVGSGVGRRQREPPALDRRARHARRRGARGRRRRRRQPDGGVDPALRRHDVLRRPRSRAARRRQRSRRRRRRRRRARDVASSTCRSEVRPRLDFGALATALELDAANSRADGGTGDDVVVVASAGNEGTTQPWYPAAATGVIAVGAVTKLPPRSGRGDPAERASFSNHGPWVDCATAGVGRRRALRHGLRRSRHGRQPAAVQGLGVVERNVVRGAARRRPHRRRARMRSDDVGAGGGGVGARRRRVPGSGARARRAGSVVGAAGTAEPAPATETLADRALALELATDRHPSDVATRRRCRPRRVPAGRATTAAASIAARVLGVARRDEGDLAGAADAFAESLRWADDADDEALAGRARISLVGLHIVAGDLAAARAEAARAAPLLTAGRPRPARHAAGGRRGTGGIPGRGGGALRRRRPRARRRRRRALVGPSAAQSISRRRPARSSRRGRS